MQHCKCYSLGTYVWGEGGGNSILVEMKSCSKCKVCSFINMDINFNNILFFKYKMNKKKSNKNDIFCIKL